MRNRTAGPLRWRVQDLKQVSDGHHLEIFLARRTLRAGPVHGHVFPLGARRNAVLRIAQSLVVNPAANQAHPGFVFHVAVKKLSNRMNSIVSGAPAA
jgi:hypothetical protein